MGGRRASAAGPGRPTEFTQTLLARLGLPPDATPDDVEAAHGRLVAYLDAAPDELRAWARRQARAADAALDLLTDAVTEVGGETVRDDRGDEPSVGGEPDEQPRVASDEVADGPHGELEDDAFDESRFDEDHFDEDEVDEDLFAGSGSGEPRAAGGGDRAGATNSRKRAGQKKPYGSRVPADRRATRANRHRPAVAAPDGWLHRFRLVPIALILAAVAVVYVVYRLGDPGGVPPVSPNASSGIDEAEVATLMTKLEANPGDVQTLRTLGDLFFQAGDYKAAATWQQKIVDIDPKDVAARLALGASLFNQGDGTAAEKQWLEVVALDPNHAEAHYDLGFLYLSKDPPDMAKVKAEWARVVESDPNSELAKTVSAHLQQLESPSPSPSASGG